MDQIGKLYQNRAMILQEEVTRLEQLLLELRINIQNPNTKKFGQDPTVNNIPQTNTEREQSMPVGGNSNDNPENEDSNLGPFGFVKQMGKAAYDSPYLTALSLAAGGYYGRKVPNSIANIASPSRLLGGLIGREYSPENGGRWSPFPKPKINLQGQEVFGELQEPRNPFNPFDKRAYRKGEAFLIQRGEQAKAIADAEEKATKAAESLKQQVADAKSYDLSQDLAAKYTGPGREPDEITGYNNGKPIYRRGALTPEGQGDVGRTQEGIYPYEKPGAQASAEMQSGQMRRTAVSDLSDLSPSVRQGIRDVTLGNGAAVAKYPQAMTGRQVAGKIAGKVLNAAGRLTDPMGAVASDVLGMGARALGAGAEVVGGASMLPLAIMSTDRQAGGQEQAGSIEGPPIYTQDDEDQARKYEQDLKNMERNASNPSGRFTPEPQTQSERDDITNFGYSNAVTLDQRRTAAKNNTRRGEYSTLQDRPTQ